MLSSITYNNDMFTFGFNLLNNINNLGWSTDIFSVKSNIVKVSIIQFSHTRNAITITLCMPQ